MTIQEEVRQGLGAWYEALPQDAIAAAENALRQVDTEAQGGAYILPNREDIFRAFQLTPPQNVKFVLVGQDPYPTIGHAMGLAFSVRRDVKPFPRSLQNIFKELRNDLGIPMPETGDLSAWAQQGGLLLNTSLGYWLGAVHKACTGLCCRATSTHSVPSVGNASSKNHPSRRLGPDRQGIYPVYPSEPSRCKPGLQGASSLYGEPPVQPHKRGAP